LFGSRTAGAGGYVFAFEFPNTHGIAMCSYTASIAERTNQQKIENLGVSPDVPYEVTLEDLQNSYEGYIKAVNQTVQGLLEQPPQ
jgi:C-terminal processing protease CtpA/Prc